MAKKKIIIISASVAATLLISVIVSVAVLVSVNRSPKALLRECIDNYDVNEELYTPNSYAQFSEEYQKSQEVLNKLFVLPGTIEFQQKKVIDAHQALVLRADKTVLIENLEDTNKLDLSPFTSSSATEVLNAIYNAKEVIADNNVSNEKVNDALTRIEMAKAALEIATVGEYEIVFNRKQLNNNHVGNSYSFSCSYNGNSIKSGVHIEAALNSTAEFYVKITDNDDVPESGAAKMSVTLSGGATSKAQITVTENRGQYAGNRATWEVEIQVKLISKKTASQANGNISFDYKAYSISNPPVSITLHTNSSQIPDSVINISDGNKYELPLLQSSQNYLFAGWYYDSEFTTPVNNDELKGTYDFYAKWIDLTKEVNIIEKPQTVSVGAESKCVSFFIPSSGKYKIDFRVSNYFVAVDVNIQNTTNGKISYESLTFGARDYSAEFEASAGDVITIEMEGFDVAEFHGYDFTYTVTLISNKLPTEYTVKALVERKESTVTYNEYFKLEPLYIDGFDFIGFFTEEGKQITDNKGNSLQLNDILGNITVYAKYELAH